jgi:hypothetical protein
MNTSIGGFRPQDGADGTQLDLDVFGQHVARRVGNVDAVGAVTLHQPGFAGQPLATAHVAHHQKADGVHVELACQVDVLFRHIRLGAVRCHTHRVHAKIAGHAQMIDRADARNQQR